jgi:DNA polymerase/3'-5' exonuclease PolX
LLEVERSHKVDVTLEFPEFGICVIHDNRINRSVCNLHLEVGKAGSVSLAEFRRVESVVIRCIQKEVVGAANHARITMILTYGLEANGAPAFSASWDASHND